MAVVDISRQLELSLVQRMGLVQFEHFFALAGKFIQSNGFLTSSSLTRLAYSPVGMRNESQQSIKLVSQPINQVFSTSHIYIEKGW